MGLRPSISPKMQPAPQMSMALLYSWEESITSGARYQRVTTYSVRLLGS